MLSHQEKQEIIKRVINADVIDVVSLYVDLEEKNQNNATGLCPFHNDKNIGNFLVDKRRGIYKCFSCDEGGKGGIDFVIDLKGINFKEAVQEIAEKFGWTNENLFRDYSMNKNEQSEKKKSVLKKEPHNIPFQKYEEDVYSESRLAGYFNLFYCVGILDEEDKKYLKSRGAENEIGEHLYISLNKKNIEEMERMLNESFKELTVKNPKAFEIWNEVPGFYLDEEKNIRFNFKGEGIAIGLRNEKKLVVGVQVRTKKETKNGRYFWLTSSDRGVSSGTPLDIVFPPLKGTQLEYNIGKNIFITEGHFKAVALKNQYNSVSISVQGITNWKNINHTLKNLQNERKKEDRFKNVLIAFDSDFFTNINVLKQMQLMSSYIMQEHKNVYYTLWHPMYGKGVDDVINNGYEHKLISSHARNFNEYIKNLFVNYPQNMSVEEEKAYLLAYFDKMLKKLKEVDNRVTN